jgi:hypothetical protein
LLIKGRDFRRCAIAAWAESAPAEVSVRRFPTSTPQLGLRAVPQPAYVTERSSCGNQDGADSAAGVFAPDLRRKAARRMEDLLGKAAGEDLAVVGQDLQGTP